MELLGVATFGRIAQDEINAAGHDEKGEERKKTGTRQQSHMRSNDADGEDDDDSKGKISDTVDTIAVTNNSTKAQQSFVGNTKQ